MNGHQPTRIIHSPPHRAPAECAAPYRESRKLRHGKYCDLVVEKPDVSLSILTLDMPVILRRSTVSKHFEQSFGIFGRPFVKRFALCYQTVVCLSVLSVTLVYCGQTVGWIKMKFGVLVGIGPSDIVLDGDPAPSPKKKGSQPPPQF